MNQRENGHPDPDQFPDYTGQQPGPRPAYDPRLDQSQSLSTASSPDPQSRRIRSFTIPAVALIIAVKLQGHEEVWDVHRGECAIMKARKARNGPSKAETEYTLGKDE